MTLVPGTLAIVARFVDPQHGPWFGLDTALADNDIVITHADLDRWGPERVDDTRLQAVLGAEMGRYERLTTATLRARLVASRLLIKLTVGAVIGSRWDQLELGFSATGKMHVRGIDQIEVSLSHNARILVVAVSRTGPVGVDVEAASRPLLGGGIEALMCTAAERAALATLPAAVGQLRAVQIWTLKEAYTKALGQGLQFNFNEFGFGYTGDTIGLTRADGTPLTDAPFGFSSLMLGEHVVSVAVRRTAGAPVRGLQLATVLDPRITACVRLSLRPLPGPG